MLRIDIAKFPTALNHTPGLVAKTRVGVKFAARRCAAARPAPAARVARRRVNVAPLEAPKHHGTASAFRDSVARSRSPIPWGSLVGGLGLGEKQGEIDSEIDSY